MGLLVGLAEGNKREDDEMNTPGLNPTSHPLWCEHPGSVDELRELIGRATLARAIAPLPTDDGTGEVGLFIETQRGGIEYLYTYLITRFHRLGFWPLLSSGLDGALFTGPNEPVELAPFLEGELTKRGLAAADRPAVVERATAASPDATVDLSCLQAYENEAFSAGLVIVPVHTPADVLAATGWQGAGNHVDSTGALSAILRSWQRRFGAVPLRIGPDTLGLRLTGPRVEAEELKPMTYEHEAFCPDVIDQSSLSREQYAETINSKTGEWRFWWD